MEDFERYGDYNETEDESPKTKNIWSLVLKIVASLLIISVVGVVGARMFTFSYYPPEMKKLYFTPSLLEYYNSKDGSIEILTQSLRAQYDDPNEGNFFCDHLIIIPDAGHLQICLRYNVSIVDGLKEHYGFENFDPKGECQFSFRLWRNGNSTDPDGWEVGKLAAVQWTEFAMYRYCRLSFENVDFGFTSEDGADWIRLEIFIDGVEKDGPFMVAIYENNENYSKFSKYKLTKGERP